MFCYTCQTLIPIILQAIITFNMTNDTDNCTLFPSKTDVDYATNNAHDINTLPLPILPKKRTFRKHLLGKME